MKKFKELTLNMESVMTVLVQEIEERETSSGKKYCRITISDGSETVIANMWNTEKAQISKFTGILAKTVIVAKTYQGAATYQIDRLAEADPNARIEDYILSVPMRSDDMYREILDMLKKEEKGEKSVIRIAIELYEENQAALLSWAAAKSIHHNCYGGLLYHVYRMMKAVLALGKVYDFDMETLLAAAALHDIGKLKELRTSLLGVADYTVEGSLMGHTLLGLEMITKIAEDFEIPQEKLLPLKHAIAAHHGKLEYGAITLPATREALLLHQIDMIDSQMYQCEEVEKKTEPGKISEKVFGLGNVGLYIPE